MKKEKKEPRDQEGENRGANVLEVKKVFCFVQRLACHNKRRWLINNHTGHLLSI